MLCVSNRPVVSTIDHVALRSDGAVDGGARALCWGPQQETEDVLYVHQGRSDVPCDVSVHKARIHREGHHTKRWRETEMILVFMPSLHIF